jgi:aryl-alcohol dehydrogenase-like predicted oxidoreductase
MEKVFLGNTGLEVTKAAMGCLPVQRCSMDDGAKLIRAAYEGGINFFDTANAYTDSEEKVGSPWRTYAKK